MGKTIKALKGHSQTQRMAFFLNTSPSKSPRWGDLRSEDIIENKN
jgi:hypothetical protein